MDTSPKEDPSKNLMPFLEVAADQGVDQKAEVKLVAAVGAGWTHLLETVSLMRRLIMVEQ